MATKRKLSEILSLGGESEPAVHIHVPTSTPDEDIVRGSEAFTNTVAELVRERNELRRLNEQLNRKTVYLIKTNERLEAERDLCRRQTHEYIRANGELAATIGGMLAFAENARHTALVVQNISDAMRPEPAPQPQTIYDQNGMPLSAAPEPTLAEIESLSTVLARTGE